MESFFNFCLNFDPLDQDRSKIDPRGARRHQWDSGVFAELLASLEGDEEIDLVNMFQRLANFEPSESRWDQLGWLDFYF